MLLQPGSWGRRTVTLSMSSMPWDTATLTQVARLVTVSKNIDLALNPAMSVCFFFCFFPPLGSRLTLTCMWEWEGGGGRSSATLINPRLRNYIWFRRILASSSQQGCSQSFTLTGTFCCLCWIFYDKFFKFTQVLVLQENS